ncbi:MAG: hypothetical protein LBF27_06750 [Sphingobacterium sp.]|nr:hypothetical protein [Sphingobacterium sp.]
MKNSQKKNSLKEQKMQNSNIRKWLIIFLFVSPCFIKAQSTYLEVVDTRSQPTLPSEYNRAAKFSFKENAAIGFPEPRYSTIMGVRGWWNDDSGGPAHEIAFTLSKGLYYRAGTMAGGWNKWCKVLIENVNGNVGIGVDAPPEKLCVDGKILAKEIKIKTDVTVPDYVFDPSYKLPTLSSIEEYVKKHRHLPEIPSASDIQKDGVNLTEMNFALLKKVEELTLHLIAKDKKIESQEDRLAKLEEQIKKLMDTK